MPETITIESWLCVDSAGNHAVGLTDDGAVEAYESEVGRLNDVAGFRLIQLCLTVQLPSPVTLTGIVPADGESTLTVT